MVFRSGAAATPISCSNALRLSSVRLKPATICTLSDSLLARVSTLAQRPSPTIPTFTGSAISTLRFLEDLRLHVRGSPLHPLFDRHHRRDIDLDQHARPRELADDQQRVCRHRDLAERFGAALSEIRLEPHVGQVAD